MAVAADVSDRQAEAEAGTARQRARRRNLVDVIAHWHPVALFVAAFVVVAVRRPEAILHPAFVAEDGRVFFMSAYYDGFASVLTPYAGVLYVGTRLIALAEQFIPIAYAPLFGALASLAITAAIAAYVAGDALENVVPDRRVRLALALVFLLVANTEMTLGRPTYLQFYMGVFLVAAAVAGRAGPLAYVAIALCSATGPFGMLVTPLYAARVSMHRDRDSWIRLAAVGIPAAVQAVILLRVGREGPVTPLLDPVAIALSLGGHLITQLIGGSNVVIAEVFAPPLWLTAPIAIALALVVVAAARSLATREWVVLAYVSVAVLASSFALGLAQRSEWLIPYSGARYFVVPGVMLGTLIVLSAARHNRAGMALALLLMVGAVSDFRLPPPTEHHWRAESACIGGPVPCTVPVYPGGNWDIQYEPGRRSW
jgi:hypothetical protein